MAPAASAARRSARRVRLARRMAPRSRCEENWVTENSSCETLLNVIKLSYTWVLHSFSVRPEETGQEIQSSTFSTTGHENLKWCLDLYPNGINEECKDFVGVYLRLVSSEKNCLLAEYKIAFLREGGRKINVRKVTARFAPGDAWGFADFMKRDRLLKLSDHLLPNDKLTIYCEVLAFVDSVNVTSRNGSVAVPNCRLSDDLSDLLQSRRFCDVTLSAAGQEMHAHKSILAARCPIFAAMFEHKMKEEKEGRVDIADLEFEVLREMVQFIYTGRAPKLNVEMAEKVLVAANKYDLVRLKAMCEDILCSKLSVTTAAEMLVFADMHNADQLKANAVRWIKADATGVMQTDGWKAMASQKPHLVVEVFRALATENVVLKYALKVALGSK